MPRPEVLDPVRVGLTMPEEHDAAEQRARLHRALEEACSYGGMLWGELERVRGFLAEMADPAAETVPRPTTQAAWENWARVYTEITSAMAGPTGDSGLALGEARRMAQRNGVAVLGAR